MKNFETLLELEVSKETLGIEQNFVKLLGELRVAGARKRCEAEALAERFRFHLEKEGLEKEVREKGNMESLRDKIEGGRSPVLEEIGKISPKLGGFNMTGFSFKFSAEEDGGDVIFTKEEPNMVEAELEEAEREISPIGTVEETEPVSAEESIRSGKHPGSSWKESKSPKIEKEATELANSIESTAPQEGDHRAATLITSERRGLAAIGKPATKKGFFSTWFGGK